MGIITRWRSFAKYWKYFVARFNDVHAFGYNFAGSERIWMKFGELRVYCLELALTDFARSVQKPERETLRKFVFLSGKQRTTLPISGQPYFMKFAHKTWFCDVMNPFRIIFWKLALKGSFFQKTVIIVNNFRLQEAISRKWLQILENDDRLARLWNVGFPSVPLESTQIHSPGQQSPYTEWLSSTHRCRTAMQLAHAALTWHYIITNSFAGRQHHLDVALLLSF